MYEDLLRELRCCPDAEYGCSRCKLKESLHCRETLMRESADAIEKLKEELADKPKWIPVTERLPEEDAIVILTDHIDVGTGWFNGKGWRTPFADIDEYRITHWMPLPEPPKEGGGDNG